MCRSVGLHRQIFRLSNVRKDARYPATLFVTSTRDDRVHPAHATEDVRAHARAGADALVLRNIEGGHGAASNNEQRALMTAIDTRFCGKPWRNAVTAMRAIESRSGRAGRAAADRASRAAAGAAKY